ERLRDRTVDQRSDGDPRQQRQNQRTKIGQRLAPGGSGFRTQPGPGFGVGVASLNTDLFEVAFQPQSIPTSSNSQRAAESDHGVASGDAPPEQHPHGAENDRV